MIPPCIHDWREVQNYFTTDLVAFQWENEVHQGILNVATINAFSANFREFARIREDFAKVSVNSRTHFVF